MVEPPRPARTYKKRGLVKALGKNPPTAMRHITDERRTFTRRRICLPAQGRSATCLSYRLWIRRDLAPHNGHLAIPASDRTTKIIESTESLTLSTANPSGTSDETRKPVRMTLVPRWRTAISPANIIECKSEPNIGAYSQPGSFGSSTRQHERPPARCGRPLSLTRGRSSPARHRTLCLVIRR